MTQYTHSPVAGLRKRIDADSGALVDIVDQNGASIWPAVSALVSGAGNGLAASVNQGPALFVVSDSIQAQTVDAPQSGTIFGGTLAKGSYYNGATKTVGVTNVYAENPCRMAFRAAHNLVTSDEVMLYSLPSNHPLACRRYTVTVTSATEVTLNGIDATAMPAVTSGGASSDVMAFVDMAYSNAGPLSHMLHELGPVFSRIDGVMRPGATSAQLAGVINTQWPSVSTQYAYGILHCGRNDGAFDEASLTMLRDAMLARCGWVLVCLPYPDGTTGNGYASAMGGFDAAGLAKIKAIGDWWVGQQATYSQIKLSDLYGVISNPAYSLESAISTPQLLSSDGTHPAGDGSLLLGLKQAADFPDLSGPRRALSRVGSGSTNLLTGGRFTGTAGTVGSGVTGTVATGFTVGGRSGANVSGGYVQVCRTPAFLRASSAAYVAGDILDVGDGWWYIVKTGGTTASSLPAGYASAVLYDNATGVTDGTVVAFRIPQFEASSARVEWQFMDVRLSADGGSEYIGFYQSISLPGTVAVGDYVRGQMDIVRLGGLARGLTLRLTANDSVPTQIARAHANAIKVYNTITPSVVRKARTLHTPKLRVPSTTATLELRLVPYPLGTGGLQFMVALPVLEETTGPGQIA
jgi:hypothetical protein